MSLPNYYCFTEDGFDNDQTFNGDENPSSRKDDLWDDGAGSGLAVGNDFDLSEISKASLQFRNDMENMRLGASVEITEKEADTMESLLEEQNFAAGVELDAIVEEPISHSLSSKVEDAPQTATVAGLGLSDLSRPSLGVDLNIIEPSRVLGEPSTNNFFGKSLIADNVFLGSNISQSSSLLAPAFGVGGFFPSENILYTPPPPPPVEPEWFYTDPQQNVQGPFTQENMRIWNEAGYFSKELPIKLRTWTEFHLFRDVFPDPRSAFYTTPLEPVRPKLHNSLSFLLPLSQPNTLVPNDRSSLPSLTDNFGRNVGTTDLGQILSRPTQERPSLIASDSAKRNDIKPSPTVPADSAMPLLQVKQVEQFESATKQQKVEPDDKRNNQPVQSAESSNSSKLSAEKSDYAKQLLGITKKSNEHSGGKKKEEKSALKTDSPDQEKTSMLERLTKEKEAKLMQAYSAEKSSKVRRSTSVH